MYGANPGCVLRLSHTSWRRERHVHVHATNTAHWEHSPRVTLDQATISSLPLRTAKVTLERLACWEPINLTTMAAVGLGITLEKEGSPLKPQIPGLCSFKEQADCIQMGSSSPSNFILILSLLPPCQGLSKSCCKWCKRNKSSPLSTTIFESFLHARVTCFISLGSHPL